MALIRDRKDNVEVAFSESALFYQLAGGNPNFEEILLRLREAKEKKRAVPVLVDSPDGDEVRDVQAGDQVPES
ncbi:MAG: hypothetical protein DMG35_11815 [Acidobacteria bacterium]|nr:MAG: hypothetical protein AUH86_04450 [Acidobacteria bacterium 13_1_40CM_4_58_4]PYT60308.1 MAG: hypothetical protein DMG35_11815 [Acidobacteriota bacterium]